MAYACRVLASLNLPAALEDVSGGSKVPHSLLEKAANLREMGGIRLLEQRMQDMPELLKRNKEILDEVCLPSVAVDTVLLFLILIFVIVVVVRQLAIN